MQPKEQRFIFSADCANRDPFRGLPDDFVPNHSRFPLVPCKGYGDLSFDPEPRQNADQEDRKVGMTDEERRALRSAMILALGDLVEISPAGRRHD